MRAALLVFALCAAGCKRVPAPPARFCNQDLSGVWVNASDPSYAYRLEDRGDVVRGKFFQRDKDGGEVAPEEPMLIELHRRDQGLAGVMKTTGESPSGRKCPVDFGLRVSSCQPGVLQVVAETQAGVRDDCSRAREADGGEAAPVLTEYRWDKLP